MSKASSEPVPPDPYVDVGGFDRDQALAMLSRMLVIREFETVAGELSQRGAIPGGLHLATGQEAVAVGVAFALEPTDVVTATHRSHHIGLAKGLSPREMMAELYGKATGCAGGRGGHMHLADLTRGHFGSNGIVGGGLGIALGASLASRVLDREQVAVGFVGDGGANVGRVWEFVNLAALWQLPLIIVCENNLYSVETPVAAATAGADIARRALGFGLPAHRVDGQDVAAVYRLAGLAAARARSGLGPTFIEACTYRLVGHNVGDQETYRTREEVAEWSGPVDPIARFGAALLEARFMDEADLASLRDQAAGVVADAVRFAEESAYPDVSSFATSVTFMDMKIRGNL
jgi:pyruvate dehydrogenase E1 component alpha subunit